MYDTSFFVSIVVKHAPDLWLIPMPIWSTVFANRFHGKRRSRVSVLYRISLIQAYHTEAVVLSLLAFTVALILCKMSCSVATRLHSHSFPHYSTLSLPSCSSPVIMHFSTDTLADVFTLQSVMGCSKWQSLLKSLELAIGRRWLTSFDVCYSDSTANAQAEAASDDVTEWSQIWPHSKGFREKAQRTHTEPCRRGEWKNGLRAFFLIM